MVSPQATQDNNFPHPKPTDWRPRSGDSVRITAEVRRQVLAEFLADALTVQRAVSEGERIDRESSDTGLRLYTQADLKVSNAVAIQQWISSNLAAYTGNRDFKGVAK